MTLREQIEALPFPFHWALDRQAILDIIDQHECYQDGLNEAAHAAADEWADHRCIPDRDALARALHIVSGMPHPEGSVLSEFECYCRRIATVDTTPDGPIDPGWGEAEFDPAAWGETAQSPTGCEMVAAAIIAVLGKSHEQR